MKELNFVKLFFGVMFLVFVGYAIFLYQEKLLIYELLSGFTALVCLAMVFSKQD
ncbi:hypothetical protein I6N95_25935 [Vagococcus sp. BWB3-3]|uniref:Uncharacterized protein n=1 Tax=Vagococcus allomyrinae TaxID=2794353 RepID=A0A940PKC2_9ENTE|nr:hypothetical protein [Vagococcus allomyrinae]MBP1044453.1 hypothetical protein [Vagococcus allomyrinae]